MRKDVDLILAKRERRRTRGWVEIVAGVLLVAAGFAMVRVMSSGAAYLAAFAPVAAGFVALLTGTLRLLRVDEGLAKPTNQTRQHGSLNLGFGFRSFVAWRYLMARDHRVSRIVLSVLFVALFIFVAALMAERTIVSLENPLRLQPEMLKNVAAATLIAKVAGAVLLYFALLVGLLRYVFSFFSTVPLVGVWIGTGALVCVLAVMSGFETDLREKILGSNAHIQITREEGEFTNWREIRKQIEAVPGVVASSPYAVSEVVIAANNNGMNVIIKGIDPESVGKVTNLIDSLKDKDAMTRLAPLVDDTHDLSVPAAPAPSGDVVDPPPEDMPGAAEPIDFSQPRSSGTGAVDLPPPPAFDRPPPIDADNAPLLGNVVDDYGGDARAVQDRLDPPPPDLITTDDEPIDFSGGDDEDSPIHVIDVPMEPSLSRRVQSLPGVLVGRELVKQTHLYVGEEVRIVSPLSDPANPDATGTPIPFNRDYRVAGVFFTGMYEYDLKYVYVTLDSLTDFLDRGDTVDGIEVRIRSADDTDAYVARFQKLLGPEYRVQDWKELNRSLFSALKLEKIAMFLVLGIVILVASFSIVGNLIMVVVEKAREIALLKTLGASDTSLMTVFAIQGLLIGVIGTGLGVATGLIACWFGKEYGIPLNPDVYYIDRMPVHVDPMSVAITGAAGVLISMAATFYPALVAARVRPAAGMRH